MRRFKFLLMLTLAVLFLLVPIGAEATPALSPISDRGLFSLTDAEWDVLGQIQRQCQEVTEGRRTSTAMEIDAPRLLGKNEWTVDDFGIEPVVAMTVYDHVEDQIDLSFKGHISGMLDSHIHRIMNAIHFIAPSSVDWEDRYGWIQMDTQWNMDKRGDKWFVSISYAAVDLPVCPEYSSGADYEVSQDKVQRIRDALDRAQEIASRHAGEPAAQRLRSYEDDRRVVALGGCVTDDTRVPHVRSTQVTYRLQRLRRYLVELATAVLLATAVAATCLVIIGECARKDLIYNRFHRLLISSLRWLPYPWRSSTPRPSV